MRRIGYYLSLAYYDILFRIFFCVLVAKLVLFCYLTFLRIDSFMPTFGTIIAILSLSLLINKYIHKFIYLLICDIILSFLFLTHSLYFKYFGDFASIYNINQIHQLTAVYSSIIHLIGFEFLFVIDLMFLPALLLKVSHNIIYNYSERVLTVIVILLTGILLNSRYLIHYEFSRSIFARYILASNMGIINYQLTDILFFVSGKLNKVKIGKADVAFVEKWLARHNSPITDNVFTGIGKGKNLLVIQFESLQNFVIGKRYKGREITPYLNSLLNHGIFFRNFFDQTGDGNSSDAMFLANSSLYPARRGAVAFLNAHNSFDSLAKLLTDNGYTTAVMGAYYKNYWNYETLDRSLGFEYQLYESDYIMEEQIGMGLSDRSFFSQSLEKINELPTPFYVLMRTLTSHDPFTAVTKEIDDFPLGDLEGKEIGGYLRSMHYVDSAIGDFLRDLSESGLLYNTVIVVYGDHRARLSEHELKRIGVDDMAENKKIPLIISCVDWKPHGSKNTIGALIDLTPTLSNILGINTSGKFFLGHDLAQDRSGYAIFRDGSFIGQGSIDSRSAREVLTVSDLILENDMIPLLRRQKRSSAGNAGVLRNNNF